MTGKMNDIQISIRPGYQMFVVFHTSGNNVGKGFHAKILQGIYLHIIRLYTLTFTKQM